MQTDKKVANVRLRLAHVPANTNIIHMDNKVANVRLR